MKVLSIRDTKLHSFICFISERKFVFIYSFVLLIGLVLGSFFSGKQGLETLNLKIFFENFLVSRRGSAFSDLFINTLFSGCAYLAFLFFGGMFAFGGVLDGILLLFKGSSVGLLMGYSYLTYGLKGVAFSLLIILPSAFISSFTLIISAKESYFFSVNFYRLFSKNPPFNSVLPEFKSYCIKFIVFLVFIVFSALIDGVMTAVFWKVFNL